MVEGSDSLENQVGKVVRAGVRAGEPVVKANVISRGESGFLAAVLSPGMRAITLSVNAVVGVAGFVFPGDKVDIILSHDVQLPRSDGTAGTVIHNVSETIMRDVRVIGVDQRSNDQETQPAVSSVVTLEVAADAAERLALASKMGELRLALRSLTPVTDDNIELGGGSAADFSKAAEEEGHTLTLDSDLSKIIAPPSGPEANSAAEGRTRALNKVTVTRGSSSTAVEVR
jgi:pilus assembly protein CpaB